MDSLSGRDFRGLWLTLNDIRPRQYNSPVDLRGRDSEQVRTGAKRRAGESSLRQSFDERCRVPTTGSLPNIGTGVALLVISLIAVAGFLARGGLLALVT